MTNQDYPEIVVTGMGIICCLGRGVEAVWKALISGACGIRPIERFDRTRYSVQNGGEVKGFDFAEDGPDAATQLLLAASQEAAEQAGLNDHPVDPSRGAIILGTNFGSAATMEEVFRLSARSEPIPPALWREFTFESAAERVGEQVGWTGPQTVLSLSCASGNATIGLGLDRLRQGEAEVVLAGGYDLMTEFVWSGLSALRTMAPDEVRPFDRRRNGTIFSEGAAVLVLETRRQAEKRGAEPLAVVAGHAMNNNAYHLTHPDKGARGLAEAMQAALADAGLAPEAIDHINAHGTGTKLNDSAETEAIKAVFGRRAHEIPVNSIKAAVGHVMGAASSVEAVASIMTIREGVIPPTIHYEEPDPECDLDYVPNESRKRDVRTVMSNSAGIGGGNAVVIFHAA